MLISDKEQELSAEVIRLKAENRDYTATTLIEGIAEQIKLKTVGEIFNEQMQRLADEGRRKYMLSLHYVYNTLIAFNKHLDIYFSEIDITFLRRYETWLRKRGVAENTIGIHFRSLRAVYNIAIEQNAPLQNQT